LIFRRFCFLIKNPAEHYCLATEYLELYSKAGKKAGCRERLKDLLAQLPSRPVYPGADKTGMKKGVVGESGR
jgi:hypothetical protein